MSLTYNYIEIDNALYDFTCENTFSKALKDNFPECALNLFNSLNYPISEVQEDLFNLSPESYFAYDFQSLMKKSDGKYLNYVHTISELFMIGETTQDIFDEEFYEDDNFEIRLINFLAVDLKDVRIDEYCTRIVTKVLSNYCGNPVFVLFRHGNKISFGLPLKRRNKFNSDFDTTQTQFVSDWINCLNPSHSDIQKCIAFSFDELQGTNIGEFYFRIFDAMGYYLDRHSLKYCKELDGKIYEDKDNDCGFQSFTSELMYGDYTVCKDYLKERFVLKKFGSGRLIPASDSRNYHSNTQVSVNKVPEESEGTTTETVDDVMSTESVFANISTVTVSDDSFEIGELEIQNLNQGSVDMEKDIVKTLFKHIQGLESSLNNLTNFYREKSMNLPQDLALAERREYVNRLFDREESLNNAISDFKTLKMKLMAEMDFATPSHLIDIPLIEEQTKLNISEAYSREDNGKKQNNYSFTNPYTIMVLGQPIQVSNWTDVLLKLCEKMISLKPDIVKSFDKADELRGRNRKYFSYESSELTEQAKKLSNGIFVETNFSANHIVNLCGKILEECGYSQNDIKFNYNHREQKLLDNDNSVNQASSVSSDIIYFPLKYGSINITYSLMKSILQVILDLGQRQYPYLENWEMVNKLSDKIKAESHYGQPHHVIKNVRLFLMDLGIVSLFEGAKRGKYILKEPESLRDLIKEKDMIIELLKSN